MNQPEQDNLPSTVVLQHNPGIGDLVLPKVLPCLDLVDHPALMEVLGVSPLQAAAAAVPTNLYCSLLHTPVAAQAPEQLCA